MPIHVLPDVLVARIAAGEVVERPASAVKELVENAIDAGARDIRVECVEGGRRLIRITDDGSGIRADEAALAFTHHATSKLTSIDDLERIATLGFRGEALASIAAVSAVTCVTRHADEPHGTLLRIDNAKVVSHERMGRPPGTTMTIENLFARVPARLKFLKSVQTERGHIDAVVTRYALAYPAVRFTLAHDGRVHFQSNGSGKLLDVLIETHGAEAAASMIPVGEPGREATDMGEGESIGDGPRHGSRVAVRGYVGLPLLSHNNRTKITLFVNGRPVQDTKLAYAVVQAYHTLLMVGRYPVAVVLIDVPPEDVDVNAHPAKAEVRFRDADGVFGAVQRAVRSALLQHMPVPEPPSIFTSGVAGPGSPVPGAPAWPAPHAGQPGDSLVGDAAAPASAFEHAAQPALAGSATWERVGIARNVASAERPAMIGPNAGPVVPSPRAAQLPALRILGQLAATYIIAEGPEGLYLVDQHAAHERVLFERMLAQRELGVVAAQALLDPVPVEIPLESAHRLEERAPMLRDLGFDIEHFGGKAFLVRAVPAVMVQDDVAAALREIVADLEMGDAPLRRDLEARVLRRVCKRMAVKAGRVMALQEMAALVRDLEACESPRTCPHGRPTIIQISVGQLEREFGRVT